MRPKGHPEPAATGSILLQTAVIGLGLRMDIADAATRRSAAPGTSFA